MHGPIAFGGLRFRALVEWGGSWRGLGRGDCFGQCDGVLDKVVACRSA
jgi:hypothetical protein